jgi:hypothetical protein
MIICNIPTAQVYIESLTSMWWETWVFANKSAGIVEVCRFWWENNGPGFSRGEEFGSHYPPQNWYLHARCGNHRDRIPMCPEPSDIVGDLSHLYIAHCLALHLLEFPLAAIVA